MSKDGFFLRGRIGNNANINDYKKTGFYTVGITHSGSAQNFPEKMYGYGIMLVFTGLDRAIAQIYIPHSITQGIVFRMSFNDGELWYAWNELAIKP